MNTGKLFAAASVIAIAGSIFTGTGVAGKTRDEPQAELQLAQAGGEPSANQNAGTPYRPATRSAPAAADNAEAAPPAKPSGKTRAEVIRELKQAQEDGSYVVGGSEFAFPEPVMATRSRDGAAPAEAKNKKPASSTSGN